MLAPLPGEPKGWWVEFEFDRWVAGVEAEMRAARILRAKERARSVVRLADAALRRQAQRDEEYRRAFAEGGPDWAEFVRNGGYT